MPAYHSYRRDPAGLVRAVRIDGQADDLDNALNFVTHDIAVCRYNEVTEHYF